MNPEEFLKDLRKLQQRTKCTETTCLNVIDLFEKYVGEDILPSGFFACDKSLTEAAGLEVIELHGCTKCPHVYTPQDKQLNCPHCGCSRYDVKDNPKEVTCI